MRLLVGFFVFGLLLAGQVLLAGPKTYNDPILEGLIQQHEKGTKFFKLAEKKRDAKINHLDAQLRATRL